VSSMPIVPPSQDDEAPKHGDPATTEVVSTPIGSAWNVRRCRFTVLSGASSGAAAMLSSPFFRIGKDIHPAKATAG